MKRFTGQSAEFGSYNFCIFPSSAGVNTVTSLVESKKAQLVVIAHDVDPIEVRLLQRFHCILG